MLTGMITGAVVVWTLLISGDFEVRALIIFSLKTYFVKKPGFKPELVVNSYFIAKISSDITVSG